jgi:anti-sigma-K factor RskA
MVDDVELIALLKQAAPPFETPVGLEERVFARIVPPPRPRRRFSWRWLAPIAATAAATAAAVLVLLPAGGDSTLERYRLEGGGAQVVATVQTTGVGREVTLEIDRLDDPRPEALYELWFLADDGRRVSAGTFHPDDSGRGIVRLVGAADPEVYTRIAVSREPADGKPRRQGPDVLTAVPAV